VEGNEKAQKKSLRN